MNQGLPILTDPKKERMDFSELSGASASGQITAVGSVLFKGKGLLPVHKSELLLFAPGQGFYNTKTPPCLLP
jgi:hypothetical protein